MLENQTTLERFDSDNLLGIPVTLINTVIEEIDEDGDEMIHIPDQDELIAAVALARALAPVALNGRDLVAMRKACGMSGRVFAEAVGMNASTLSRLEKNAQGMGDYLEKLIRIFVAEQLLPHAPGIGYAGAASIISMKIIAPDDRTEPRVRIVMERIRMNADSRIEHHYAKAA